MKPLTVGGLGLVIGALGTPAMAATVLENELSYDRGSYTVSFQAEMEADADAIWRIITDYDHLTRVSRVFRESEVIKIYSAARHQVRVMQYACVWVFCKSVRKTADVSTFPDWDMVIVTDPAQSDFRYSVERWRVEPRAGGGVRVYYTANFIPSFFVPPIIGPWMIKAAVREEVELALSNLELLAGGNALMRTPR